MCRHEQFHASRSSQVRGLAFIQVAHNIELLTKITPTVDRQQCNVCFKPTQALHQLVENNCIARGVHSYPSHLDDIPKIAVEVPIIMLNETEIVDGRRCLEAMHSRDRKEFNLSLSSSRQLAFVPKVWNGSPTF